MYGAKLHLHTRRAKFRRISYEHVIQSSGYPRFIGDYDEEIFSLRWSQNPAYPPALAPESPATHPPVSLPVELNDKWIGGQALDKKEVDPIIPRRLEPHKTV